MRRATETYDGYRDIKVGQVVKNTWGHFKAGDAQCPDEVEEIDINGMSDEEFAAKLAAWKALPCPEYVLVVSVKKHKNASGETETSVVVSPWEPQP